MRTGGSVLSIRSTRYRAGSWCSGGHCGATGRQLAVKPRRSQRATRGRPAFRPSCARPGLEGPPAHRLDVLAYGLHHAGRLGLVLKREVLEGDDRPPFWRPQVAAQAVKVGLPEVAQGGHGGPRGSRPRRGAGHEDYGREAGVACAAQLGLVGALLHSSGRGRLSLWCRVWSCARSWWVKHGVAAPAAAPGLRFQSTATRVTCLTHARQAGRA
jgi:hypothetical protein